MIAIQGWEIDYEDFNDNYDLKYYLDLDFGEFDDPEYYENIIPNVKIQIYKCPKKCTLEAAQEAIISKYFGDFSISTHEYGWSEYTVEGFNVDEIKIGEHDLIEILRNMDGYKIVTIEKLKQGNK